MPTLPLSQNPRTRIQLNNGTGVCWEAVFSTSSKNDQAQFKAKSD